MLSLHFTAMPIKFQISLMSTLSHLIWQLSTFKYRSEEQLLYFLNQGGYET